ncbi:triphosphoribosyl-dephospho-CoA synthase [Natrialbaceae archaeon A-CW2]|uniref:triphosphoribosyl-dephospho-CoA synthase n=1 Tax=Natronosalvus amylolyticus TaxID=2961994 RepID=UPI0020C93AAC|nr:triphosphoribosyl-dephospho-CoA synthase [Natronosalvus amylolyticus]
MVTPDQEETTPKGPRSPAENAELALLLEVAGTPKPGNVDRERDLEELWFEHFLAGAVGSRRGLERAEAGAPVGAAFETAVAGMANQRGGNTQFGCLLLLVPLVRTAAAEGSVRPALTTDTVEATTIEDAAGFYRAFDHVDVFVDDPPADLEPLDVRRGAAAIPTLEERGVTMYEVMDASVPGDDVAREWLTGFERSFRAAQWLESLETQRSATDRIAEVFLRLLGERPDTLIASKHGDTVAQEVCECATDLAAAGAFRTDRERVDTFADDLCERGINPGTTADITAAGIFIALERGGLEV